LLSQKPDFAPQQAIGFNSLPDRCKINAATAYRRANGQCQGQAWAKKQALDLPHTKKQQTPKPDR
jgi:hypothetical protein